MEKTKREIIAELQRHKLNKSCVNLVFRVYIHEGGIRSLEVEEKRKLK